MSEDLPDTLNTPIVSSKSLQVMMAAGRAAHILALRRQEAHSTPAWLRAVESRDGNR